MRLSEAILLGDAIMPRTNALFLLDTCGCAQGRATVAATGRNFEQYLKEFGCLTFPEYLQSIWPWMSHSHVSEISFMFGKVMRNEMTLEALCDQVRAWEDELAAKGVNVEQVSLAAELTEPASQAAEHTGKELAVSVATPRGGE